TNYDNLLERAYVHVRNRQIDWACSDENKRSSVLIERNPFLLKLHGDLSTPGSIVLAHGSAFGQKLYPVQGPIAAQTPQPVFKGQIRHPMFGVGPVFMLLKSWT